MLRESDPNHDVYVGPVGVWMPFHPDAYKTGRVEHLEKELNELMHEKIKMKLRQNKNLMLVLKKVSEKRLRKILKRLPKIKIS